jgi:ABC-type glycerol-3-phosphate transport system permease component
MRLKISPVQILIYVLLTAGAVIAVMPFVWMLLTSLKTYAEVANRVFMPAWPQFINYVRAWNAAPFARFFLNSLIMSVCTSAGVLCTSILAGYAFARLRFPGKNIIFMLFLATMMIPGEVTLIPNFLTIRTLGWYNTYLALIIPWTASVFHIFLLRQFFMGIPNELYDAAVLDGCGHFRFLTRIVLPLSKAALVTVAMLSFIGSWNALLWPLIVTSKESMRPIQVGLAIFVTEAGTQMQELMAAAAMTIAPIVVIYLLAQKHFTQGIATTGLKG